MPRSSEGWHTAKLVLASSCGSWSDQDHNDPNKVDTLLYPESHHFQMFILNGPSIPLLCYSTSMLLILFSNVIVVYLSSLSILHHKHPLTNKKSTKRFYSFNPLTKKKYLDRNCIELMEKEDVFCYISLNFTAASWKKNIMINFAFIFI